MSVSVIIAMPQQQQQSLQQHPESASDSLSSSTDSGPAQTQMTPSDTHEPEQLYFELGVAEVPLRFHPSSRDDEEFLDELSDRFDDDDYDNDDKSVPTRVNVTAARSP